MEKVLGITKINSIVECSLNSFIVCVVIALYSELCTQIHYVLIYTYIIRYMYWACASLTDALSTNANVVCDSLIPTKSSTNICPVVSIQQLFNSLSPPHVVMFHVTSFIVILNLLNIIIIYTDIFILCNFGQSLPNLSTIDNGCCEQILQHRSRRRRQYILIYSVCDR